MPTKVVSIVLCVLLALNVAVLALIFPRLRC